MSVLRSLVRTARYSPRVTTARRLTPMPALQRSYTPSRPRQDAKVDAIIEDITELYAAAKDEFEIAMEETEKGTTYAEDDRAAAHEELAKIEEAYKKITEGDDKAVADEVSRRIGHRLRELREGFKRMDALALEHD